ncbi:winged helix DNA-binding domain-containing protein [Nocardioides donggukensis]|uniref:AlkZ family DNA glycosylase n=1 Tax=Nocardioides donggukensis TaxID=2774019 RepID=A0A927Q0X9_9ACTN|nr:winged helix DNA-binding domain-containing protein [Nocardioides donggukensis]MBD8868934.1 AlkZ family DNA glycosylase [Nocardioides donggukensis]
MRHVPDSERRHRIAVRHAIAPAHRVADAVAATRAMTVLHATEPATVYLSLRARVSGLRLADVDRALYDDRTLVKQLAMRRTLFVFPVDLLPAAWGSASARVAEQEWRRTVKDLAASGAAEDAEARLRGGCDAVLDALTRTGGLSAGDLAREAPEVAGRIAVGVGTTWGGEIPLAPRVLTCLGAAGRVVRGGNAGAWRSSRPTWTATADWLGGPGAVPEPCPPREGYAELVRRWLGTFGPGTLRDLQWWLGSTVSAARQALADNAAVEVSLDRSETGWLLPDDLDRVPEPEPWAALLPVLDPTVMGWKQRGFYLGDLEPQLFDRNGNAGTTAWWGGRAVGCWLQEPDGRVVVVPVGDPGREARAALEVEADRLGEWLAGERVGTVYPSALMKQRAR